MKIKLFITVIVTAFHIHAEKPNIVLFFADDLDADEIHCTSEMNNIWATHTGAKANGFWNKGETGNVLTPNIDALTKDGMLFTRFYVNATVCSPSRYCLLTGRYATRGLELQNDFPVATHATLEWRPGILRSESSLPKELQKCGYRTAIIGKWHNGEDDFSDSNLRKMTKVEKKANPTYQEVLPLESSIIERYNVCRKGLEEGFGWNVVDRMEWGNSIVNLDWQCEGALNFIDQSKNQPFFLYCALPVPHGQYRFDYNQIESYDRRVTSAGLLEEPLKILPSTDDVLKRCEAAGVQSINAMATRMDDYIGAVLSKIDELGLSENTIVIFTSDHGSRGKNSAYDGGARVPMIIRWPKSVKEGSKCDSLIGSIDIAKTLVNLAGGNLPQDMQLDSYNFVSQLLGKGEPKNWRSTLLIEAGNTKGVVSRKWKYIANRVPDDIALKMKKRPGEVFWTGFDHHNYQNESMYPAFWNSDQFYDLQKDHYEQNNLINHEEYELHVDMMRKELNGYVDSLPHIFGEFGN